VDALADTTADTTADTLKKEDEMMAQINALPKELIMLMKYTAALAIKLKTHPDLSTYITPMLLLLTNLINIRKNPILTLIKSKLQLMLTTYIFYIDELLKDQLDLVCYTENHEMLIYFNKVVKDSICSGKCSELYGIII
jgi:hypothetical protein